jgi:hypothetical protein
MTLDEIYPALMDFQYLILDEGEILSCRYSREETIELAYTLYMYIVHCALPLGTEHVYLFVIHISKKVFCHSFIDKITGLVLK